MDIAAANIVFLSNPGSGPIEGLSGFTRATVTFHNKRFVNAIMFAVILPIIAPIFAVALGAQNPTTTPNQQAVAAIDEKPEGYHIGSFLIRPSLEVSTIYDSNIFATRDDEESDTILLLAPSIELSSDWDRHELEIDLGGAFGRYLDNSSEDYDDYWANIRGLYEIGENTDIFGGLGYSREHEERGSPNQLIAGSEPTTFDSQRAHLGLSHRLGRATLRVGGTHEQLDFDNSFPINNDDRDRTLTGFGGRLYYGVSKQIQIYLQTVFDKRNYDSEIDDFGFERDSKGYRAGIGVEGDLSNRLKGNIYLGYLRQKYDDSRFSNIGKVDFGAGLRWRAAPRTTMSARLDRSLEETTLPGSPGYLYTSLAGVVRHRLTPRTDVNAGFSIAEADYFEENRDDEYYSAYFGARYYLSPQWYLGAEYRLLSRDSSNRAFDPPDNSANPQSFDDYSRSQFFLRLGTLLYPVRPAPAWNMASGEKLEVSSDDWSGFYTGVQIGHDTINLKTRGRRDQGTDSSNYSNSGSSAGVFGGYGLDWNSWYLGVDFEYEDSNSSVSHSKAKDSSRSLDVDKDRTFGLALRVGHRMPTGPLLYGRLGVANTKFDSRFGVNARPDGADDDTKSLIGARFGLGADIPVSGPLFMRLDYTHTNYEDYKAHIIDIEGEPQTERIDPTGGTFRVGLGWRWGVKERTRGTHAVDYMGFYAGAQVGLGSIQSDLDGTHRDGGRPGELFDFDGDFGDDSSATGGVFVGLGFSTHQVYFGLEGELSESNGEWAHKRDPRGRNFSVEKKDTRGIFVRAGYVLDNGTLLYGRVGKVRTRFNTTWIKGENRNNDVDRDDRVWGTRVGGGAELPVGRSVYVRLDYSYTNYESYKFSTLHGNADRMRFDNAESLFAVGVGVRF